MLLIEIVHIFRSDPLLIYKNSMNWLNQQLPSSTDWELLRSHSEDSNNQNPFVYCNFLLSIYAYFSELIATFFVIFLDFS